MFKIVILKQSSKYQIKNRNVNLLQLYRPETVVMYKKGNFTVNAMEVCQKIIFLNTCSF